MGLLWDNDDELREFDDVTGALELLVVGLVAGVESLLGLSGSSESNGRGEVFPWTFICFLRELGWV